MGAAIPEPDSRFEIPGIAVVVVGNGGLPKMTRSPPPKRRAKSTCTALRSPPGSPRAETKCCFSVRSRDGNTGTRFAGRRADLFPVVLETRPTTPKLFSSRVRAHKGVAA